MGPPAPSWTSMDLPASIGAMAATVSAGDDEPLFDIFWQNFAILVWLCKLDKYHKHVLAVTVNGHYQCMLNGDEWICTIKSQFAISLRSWLYMEREVL